MRLKGDLGLPFFLVGRSGRLQVAYELGKVIPVLTLYLHTDTGS